MTSMILQKISLSELIFFDWNFKTRIHGFSQSAMFTCMFSTSALECVLLKGLRFFLNRLMFLSKCLDTSHKGQMRTRIIKYRCALVFDLIES